MAVGAVGMVAALVVLMLIGLPILALVIFLIRRKRWGVLLGGMAAVGCGLLLLLFTARIATTGYEAQQAVLLAVAERTRAAEQAKQAALGARVVSNAELIEVAAAKPKIEVAPEDITGSEEWRAPEPGKTWAPTDSSEGRPAQDATTITTDPYTTESRAKQEARSAIVDWVLAHSLSPAPYQPNRWNGWIQNPVAEPMRQAIRDRLDQFIESETVDTRETSVGQVYVGKITARIDPDDEAWLSSLRDRLEIAQRQTQGVREVVVAGGIAVGLLGCCHLVLRRGAKRTGGAS